MIERVLRISDGSSQPLTFDILKFQNIAPRTCSSAGPLFASLSAVDDDMATSVDDAPADYLLSASTSSAACLCAAARLARNVHAHIICTHNRIAGLGMNNNSTPR